MVGVTDNAGARKLAAAWAAGFITGVLFALALAGVL